MAKHLLLSFGIILAIGTICGFLAQKIKVPDVAIFLVVGMLMGPAVSGILNIPAESGGMISAYCLMWQISKCVETNASAIEVHIYGRLTVFFKFCGSLLTEFEGFIRVET
jgi:NhaP-type Na+/H+ and K+/H+ antiporter